MAGATMSPPPARERALAAARERWLAAGLGTGGCDRAGAERALRQGYATAGLGPPSAVLWCDSPLAMARVLVALIVDLHDQREGAAARQIRRKLLDEQARQRALAAARLGEQPAEELDGWLRRHLHASLRERVVARLTLPLLVEVRAALEPLSWVRLERFALDSLDMEAAIGDPLHGGGDEQPRQDSTDWSIAELLGWPVDVAGLALHETCARLLSADAGPLTGALAEVAMAAGWWWPLRHVAVLSERPALVRMDGQGRLHCDDGPAVRYPDGFALWAWHGVRVSRLVVQRPEQLTVGSILQEPDIEVRRVMVERYGPGRFLRDAGARREHVDDWGSLWRFDFLDGEPLVMVEVVNSTPEPDGSRKTYWLHVPPTVGTAREAVAWTFGMGPHEYHPRMQT